MLSEAKYGLHVITSFFGKKAANVISLIWEKAANLINLI
jgi:hypothetical protein